MSRLRFLATALGALAIAGPAAAQVLQGPGASQTIVVPKDKSAAFRLDYPASQIVVAQPDTLSLVATTDRSFYVRGKQLGVTNILIYDQSHRLAQVVDVKVGYDVESLQADLAMALPGEHVRAVNFADGILLVGEVSTPSAADRAVEIAAHYAGKNVESQLTIRTGEQVQVDVRVLEVSHTAIRDMGFGINVSSIGGFSFSSASPLPSGLTPQASVGFSGTVGHYSIEAVLSALEQKGEVRELARPNLVAMSGQEASFLAGGQFPFPIPNGNLGVTIQFQEFGVKLHVTPTVEDNGQIILKVAPEVSQLDPANGVSIQGFQVPGIDIRRAETQVELGDGQSFAIAGLFQRNYQNTINQVPGASSVPILGALFRSSDWQRKETELVIIVTPHLTAPAEHVNDLPNPLHEGPEPTSIDVLLNGQTTLAPPVDADGDLRPAAPARPGPSAHADPPAPAPSGS